MKHPQFIRFIDIHFQCLTCGTVFLCCNYKCLEPHFLVQCRTKFNLQFFKVKKKNLEFRFLPNWPFRRPFLSVARLPIQHFLSIARTPDDRAGDPLPLVQSPPNDRAGGPLTRASRLAQRSSRRPTSVPRARRSSSRHSDPLF